MTDGSTRRWTELPPDVEAIPFVVRSTREGSGFDTVEEATAAFNNIKRTYGRYIGHIAIDLENESGYILFIRAYNLDYDDGTAGG